MLGYDRTYSMGTDFSVWIAEPSLSLRWKQGESLTVSGGLQGQFHDIKQGLGSTAAANSLSAITAALDKFYVGSAFVEALWRPNPRLLIRPGSGATPTPTAPPGFRPRIRG